MSSVISPSFVASFDKSESKPFSPFQSSESTLKRQNEEGLINAGKGASMPKLNLDGIDRPNFHEEFMELNESDTQLQSDAKFL